jgi:CO dehydrogenase maturation factor
LLGEIETIGRPDRVVLADLEAGLGTLSRLEEGHVDYLLVMAEPSPKALEVARRAVDMAHERKVAHILVIANRIRNEADLVRVRQLFPQEETLVIPEDRAIEEADKQAKAPVDVAAGSPGIHAFEVLASRLLQPAKPAATSKPDLRLHFIDKDR